MNDGEEMTPVLHQKKASEMDDSHSVSPPLDGGLQAWSVVAGSFLCLFVSFGWVNCKTLRSRGISEMLTGYRHQAISDILRDPPVEGVFRQHNCMDHVF
jgi:hypothetical protein